VLHLVGHATYSRDPGPSRTRRQGDA
jgi:hypothetical protein